MIQTDMFPEMVLRKDTWRAIPTLRIAIKVNPLWRSFTESILWSVGLYSIDVDLLPAYTGEQGKEYLLAQGYTIREAVGELPIINHTKRITEWPVIQKHDDIRVVDV